MGYDIVVVVFGMMVVGGDGEKMFSCNPQKTTFPVYHPIP